MKTNIRRRQKNQKSRNGHFPPINDHSQRTAFNTQHRTDTTVVCTKYSPVCDSALPLYTTCACIVAMACAQRENCPRTSCRRYTPLIQNKTRTQLCSQYPRLPRAGYGATARKRRTAKVQALQGMNSDTLEAAGFGSSRLKNELYPPPRP